MKPFHSIPGCPWQLLEEVILNSNPINPETTNSPSDLNYLAEAAVWNTALHHKAYYGVDMKTEKRVEEITRILRKSRNQDLYNQKKRVEHFKSILTEREQYLGVFHQLSDAIFVEKELTIIKYNKIPYLFPTTMFMCVLDNIQVRFFIRLHVELKEKEENIPDLTIHYEKLHQFLVELTIHGNRFFELMKNWDAYVIGHIVADGVDDMGFQTLKNELDKEFREILDQKEKETFTNLITCHEFESDRDLPSRLALYFSNLCKNYGHPVLNPVDGIKKLRENSKKHINVDDKLAKKILWKFRETYTYAFFKKRGRYPNMTLMEKLKSPLGNCFQDCRLPTEKERVRIPLEAWDLVQLEKNHELSLEIDEKELLKDTACAPPREDWHIPYDPCAFKIFYGQRKPQSINEYEPRVLSRYLKGEEGELAKKVYEQECLFYNHKRDDLVQLCRKERELNVDGRVFCKQTYEMRLLQVCLEKSLSDNILPFIREQTMTNTELEVTKRMDKVASRISKQGNYNINLDLSKWNQLQRHDLNKYIFAEFDNLHGRKNLYSDSHLWFNRCMVLLSSRLTPPKIGENGEPEEGDFCHYNQLGGFEGMRQKAWTITTIMIIKLALEECQIEGETMGQGDNQVIHIKLKKHQQDNPNHYIILLLNSLDNLFERAGLKLKLQETWYSKNLFEYSKVRFYKSVRVDDSLKKLNRMIPDINEGFPSIHSLITGVSTTTENLSRSCLSPFLPFFLYSLETGNVFRRKGMLKIEEDKMRLPILLNCPSILGGLPVSNLYQHCQRGCPDPLTIWIKIWQTIKSYHPDIFNSLLNTLPSIIKEPIDHIRLVEDMYSLNITSLPNFERKAPEIVEEFLPNYVTNPHVLKLLGATREDLDSLCQTLITMRPYIANLAHEILPNSNEGVQLQVIGSFSNLQTINRIINVEEGRDETIFHLGCLKDKEAIQLLTRRLDKSKLPPREDHPVATVLNII